MPTRPSRRRCAPTAGKPTAAATLVTVACTECHGMDLAGYPEEGTPGLAVAKAYTPEEFDRLMRTGITKAGTESTSGLMTEMGRKRFPAFTDEEVAAIKAYLDRR
ncbi:c-type cytochrome [Arenimonas daejeonensis]|uniref:c-type cytochrome n=1 Tax=Arenimonas daejeonensis TaxID=370777 RepID=UPI0011BEB0D0|nr:c-type cytochrome [Arenimonas daejeonensis]